MTDKRTNQEAPDRIHVRDALSLDSTRTFSEPPPPSAVISAEGTALESLVHHRWSVPHDTPFDMVHRLFGERNVDFMALIRAGNVTGLCSRGQLSFMLGSRYGFALFSRSPSHLAQVAHPLVFTCTTPVRQILDSALARKGKEFHEDVILVDENHELFGLISIEALAHLQSQLVDEQLGELRRQHELNNKLAPVMGYAELLAPMVDERSQSYVGYITKSVVEAAHIIRQLLQLSKPDSGHPEIVDLRQVVEESLVMLKFKIREAGAQIRTALPATPANVLSDSAQLKQVFINLAVNALQAMEATVEPELHIAVGQGENTAWMMVRDNGVGIPPESIGRIFDPFFTTKGPDKGTGLGLSICSSIVRKSRGAISVESEPGSGATFTVSFPAANAAAITPAPIGQKTEPSVRPGGWTNYKILVVEDEDVLRRLLQEVLRSQFGCRVDPAANGAEGLVRAMQEQYDLIVSDVRMPELSGVELFLRLREKQPSMARKFIFVSGHVGDEKLDQEIRRCNVPLIAKPFTIAHLTAACLPLLRAARPGAISRH